MGVAKRQINNKLGSNIPKSLTNVVIIANNTPKAERNKKCTKITNGSNAKAQEKLSPVKNFKITRKAKLTPSGTMPIIVAEIGRISVLKVIFLTKPALLTIEFDDAIKASMFANHGP